MRKDPFKRQVMHDMGNRTDDDQALGWHSAMSVKMVHPTDAVHWVANGKFDFEPIERVREWWHINELFDMATYAREEGRLELAQELIRTAIIDGRLRMAFVSRSERQEAWTGALENRRLEFIPTSELAGYTLDFSEDSPHDVDLWPADEGDDVDYKRHHTLRDVLFFWNEVAALLPWPTDPEKSTPSAPAPTPSLPATSGPFRQTPSAVQSSGRRGRRPRCYGAPIATFLARMVDLGLEEAARQKDETLGQWLIEEFEKADGREPPDLRNASADARSALQAWIAALAQKPE
jgi:hypothetical protein